MKNRTVLYQDESGDLGLNGSDNFIITILLINTEKDYLKLKKIFKKMRKYKFKKELKIHKEIKSSKSSEVLKKYILQKLVQLNIESYSIVLDKRKHENKFKLKNNKNIEIYSEIMTELLNEINIETSFDLIVDRFLSRNNENKFNEKIQENKRFNCKIYHSNSEKWIEIQTDIIAGAVFKKFRDDDKSYIGILGNKHKIIKY